MATYAPQVASVFPVGTTVGAYPASGWPAISLPPAAGVAPVPAATESHAVAADGTVSFTGLTDNTVYYLGADTGGGAWRYSRLVTNPTSNPGIADKSITLADVQAETINAAGLAANRPAASAANLGETYLATDTGTLSRSNGTIWETANTTAWRPQDNKLLAASYDPAFAGVATSAPQGFILLSKLWVPTTITVTNLKCVVIVSGSVLTSGQNLGGLYKPDNTLIAKTASQHTNWGSAGEKTMALTAEAGQSLTIPGGAGVWVYAAILTNGTTAPTMGAPNAQGQLFPNTGLAAADGYRSAFQTTSGQTSLPSTLGALTSWAGNIWMGLN